MIEITLGELLDCTTAMQKLAEKPMKTKSAFKVARLMREIDKEYALFQETRKRLIEKYGEKDQNNELKIDENGNYSIPKERIEIFNKELRDVLEAKISLNAELLDIEEFDNLNFTPTEMVLLAPFIRE